MPRGKKVVWTQFEKDTIYSKTVAILKDKPKTKFIDAVRTAQVALEESRQRRHLAGPSQIPTDLRERFIVTGHLPKDWKKGTRGQPVHDARDDRIVDLTNQLEAAQTQVKEHQELVAAMRDRIEALENQPTPIQVIQRLVAETIAMSMTMVEDRNKAASFRPPQGGAVTHPPKDEGNLPAFERERRKDPTPSSLPHTDRPEIAVLGGDAAEQIAIKRECGQIARLRFYDDPEKFDNLRHFTSHGGRVLLWINRDAHQRFQKRLDVLKIKCRAHSGGVNSLIEEIKAMVTGSLMRRQW